jgi:hypothetical protein
MTGTMHEAQGPPALRRARPTSTNLDAVGPGAPTLKDVAARGVERSAIRRFSLGTAILAVSYAAGFFAMRWATHQGHGYEITPVSVILLVAWTLAFVIPEVVSAVRRARRNRIVMDEPR